MAFSKLKPTGGLWPKCHPLKSGFRIRFHFMRIRIQLFQKSLDPDPDPGSGSGSYGSFLNALLSLIPAAGLVLLDWCCWTDAARLMLLD
jgi:hypothetical protein